MNATVFFTIVSRELRRRIHAAPLNCPPTRTHRGLHREAPVLWGNYSSKETMMMFGKRFLLLGSCALIAVMPVASQAKQDAMDTCIQAFVAEQLPQGHKIEVVKRDTGHRQWTSSRRAPIKVSAKGKRSGKEYASATCEMNRQGELVAMVVKGARIRVAQSTPSRMGAQGG
ncbi:MAG: hypothetical protein GX535_14545 [Xanthomonadaceae bacterium]|nr:hypothetical protein [Xanthomonadaceae bacterium]